MTRDELRGIVEGISDEQLKKILDINSADVGKAKKNSDEMKKELETVNKRVEELESENSVLKDGQCEAEKMRTEIEELQKIIEDRRIEDEKTARDAAILDRFENAANGAEFLNEFTRKGVLNRFSEALGAEENTGKSDVEIFRAITDGECNLFVADGGLPSVVASTSGFGTDLSMGDVREIMGLSREG